MKKPVVLCFLIICAFFFPMTMRAAGVKVSASVGAYPEKTTISWTDNTYAIYGLLAMRYDILLDDILVASVENSQKSYSMVVAAGKHTVTVEAVLSSSFKQSASVAFTVCLKEYTISYYGGADRPSNQKKTYGEDILLSEEVPHDEGYIFLGWTTVEDGQTVEYNPGDPYTENSDLKLYAVWKVDEAYIPTTPASRFEVENGVITKYTLLEGEVRTKVKIPEEIYRNPIVGIGEGVFAGHTDIEAISLPDGVTYIGDSAFSGCTSLQSVVFPSALTEIGDSAFSNCRSLQAVILHSGVLSIGTMAFSGCAALESVALPETLESMGGYVFKECESLRAIELLNGMTSLGNGTFMGCTRLEKVTLPKQLLQIPALCFSSCAALQNITLPNSITEINSYAFSGCTRLTEIAIPENVTVLRGFSDCTALRNVTLPTGLKEIGNDCFSDCVLLENITIPDGVTTIGENAFSGCHRYNEINIPESVETIGRNAFFNSAYYLSEAHWENGVLYYGAWVLGAHPDKTGIVELNNTTKKLVEGAFDKCVGITEVYIPSGITALPARVFNHCTALQYVDIPITVTYVGEYAFAYCDGLKEVQLPDNIKEIGESAFYMCSGLERIKLPFSMTVIPEKLFYQCMGLCEVILSGGVTAVQENAFHNTEKLTDIYYGGEDWSNVTIAKGNDAVNNATVHCNYMYTAMMPTVSVPAGEVEKNTVVELICPLDGAVIYYTVDGSEPNKNSSVYRNGIVISKKTVIKAIAVKDGMQDSDVATYTYALIDTYIDYMVEYKTTASYYKFYITFEAPIENADLYVALYDSSGKMLTLVSEPCEGDNYYIISVPLKTGGVECKTFVWAGDIKPIAYSKSIK